MRHTTMLAAGAAMLAIGAGGTAQAQAPRMAAGTGVTTGALADLCAAGGGTDVVSAAAVGYCRGFFIGAGQYHAEISAGRAPIFCLPDPSPTIEAAQDSFVAWARANPQRAGDKAVDGLMRWAAETFPCATPPRSAARGAGGGGTAARR